MLAKDLRSVEVSMRPMFLAELLRSAGIRVQVPEGPIDLKAEAVAFMAEREQRGRGPSDVDEVMRMERGPARGGRGDGGWGSGGGGGRGGGGGGRGRGGGGRGGGGRGRGGGGSGSR